MSHPELTDMVIYRENSEDIYAGIEWKADSPEAIKVIKFLREEMGVKKIDAVGKQFDPNFHEAVREVDASETGAADGQVVEDLQTGFEINGKVIRPSQVVISKKQ